MKRVELLTGDGHFVALVEVIQFTPGNEPDVVMWGTRVFTKRDAEHYVEAFAVASLTPSPGLPRESEEPPPVDRSARTTIAGTAIGEHLEIDPVTKQQKDYIVLAPEERAKGFVRPVRRSYRHLKCGVITSMGQALAETYARDPGFYSGTFCVACRDHFPVGPEGEFVWEGTEERVGA